MKATIFLLFISTYVASASKAGFDRNFGEPEFRDVNKNQYKNPIDIFRECDLDQDEQLDPNELEKCKQENYRDFDRRQIVSKLEDINGDGRVDRNEVQKNIRRMTSPIPTRQGGFHSRNYDEPGFPKRQGNLDRNFGGPRYQGTNRNQQRNWGEPRFEDPTSNIRMARPPKRQGNIGDAMSDIRMAVPKRQGNHDRNFGEPELEGTNKNQYRNPSKLTNAKILACDLNKDGQLDSKEYRSCEEKYGDLDNFEEFLEKNFGDESEIGDTNNIQMASPKPQGTNSRNQQENPSELTYARIMAFDLNKDGKLDSTEYIKCGDLCTNLDEIPFENPTEIKTIVLACDHDKDGQLNSKEFEECHHFNHQVLDINGDGQVDRNEIKENVRMAVPTNNRRDAK